MEQFNLQKYLENPNRAIVTRDGKNVRIICTNKSGLSAKPIVALIMAANGDEVIRTYWDNGVETRGYEGYLNDLFFAPEKHEGWLNIYKSPTLGYNPGCVFNSKDEALNSKSKEQEYIGTCKIEWEE